jgi:hypothetical protein
VPDGVVRCSVKSLWCVTGTAQSGLGCGWQIGVAHLVVRWRWGWAWWSAAATTLLGTASSSTSFWWCGRRGLLAETKGLTNSILFGRYFGLIRPPFKLGTYAPGTVRCGERRSVLVKRSDPTQTTARTVWCTYNPSSGQDCNPQWAKAGASLH